MIPKQKMYEFIKEQEQIQLSKIVPIRSYGLNISEANIREMLSFLPKEFEYEKWRNVVWSVIGYLGTEGIKLIEEWSPDEKQKGKHLRRLTMSCDGTIGIGYLVRIATQYGYRLPENMRKLRTPGQVAIEDVFNNGKHYIAIGQELYQYDDNFYKRLPKEHCTKLIADYFNTYITDDSGKTAFATDKKVFEAYNFLLSRFYVDPDKVNPPGINLKTGYLKHCFQGKKPLFILTPHSPDIYHTYIGGFEYNPYADLTLVYKVLNDILDPDELIIFLRTLSAAFDLPMIRRLHGRNVKILILLGVGSNGKDTLRVWAELLFGGFGLTSVGLRDFVKADNAARFGLYTLGTSVINWASENDVIALDKSQNLKNFASGDPITIERKHKDSITIKPKAIGIFNANEAPHISSTLEAISSRYAFLDFPYKFVRDPKPGHPKEKKGDPRFKEDPEFIKQYILPGFLNILIKEFENLCREGIDFSSTEDTIEAVRKDSNHFYQFIQETELVPCEIEKGLTPNELFFRYEDWCAQNKLLEFTYDTFNKQDKRKVWHHPSQYDKLVTNVREITKRLRKEFPDLILDRTNSGRKVGLRFNIPPTF